MTLVPAQSSLNVFDYGAKGDGVTNDSAAIQGAINAASAATGSQIVDVLLPSGYVYSIGTRLIPKSGVRLVCYGAVIAPNWASIGNLPLMNNTSATLINGFGIAGGWWQGTGTESGNQILFASGVYGAGLGLQRARFTDMEVTNWPNAVLYLADPYKVVVDHCRMDTVTVPAGTNAINFVEFDDATNVGMVIAESNVVTNCAAGAVAYVKSAGTTNRDAQAIFRGNIVSGTSASVNALNGGLDIEVANAAATLRGFLIEGNHVNSGNTAGGWAINVGNVSQGSILGTLIRGNRLEGGGTNGVGVHVGASVSQADVFNNTILCTNKSGGLGTITLSGNRCVEGSVMSGRITLVSGTASVGTTEIVSSNDNIIINRTSGANMGVLTYTASAGVGFTVTSNNASDNSTLWWRIDH